MKKAIITTCLISLGLVILIKSNAIDSLVLFLLVGAIPGTNYSIPSGVMLLAIIGILWLIIVRFTAIELVHTLIEKRTTRRKTAYKKRLPRRRFGQI